MNESYWLVALHRISAVYRTRAFHLSESFPPLKGTISLEVRHLINGKTLEMREHKANGVRLPRLQCTKKDKYTYQVNLCTKT